MLILLALIEEREDEEKFLYIYNNYHKLVTKIVADRFADQYTVEEVVQTAFVRIAKNIKKIETENKKRLTTYVVAVARSCAADELRSAKREPEVIPFDEDRLTTQLSNGLETVFSNEIVTEMVRYILTLSHTYRDVLYLYYAVGMSVKRIAYALGLNEKTARTRLARGTEMLRTRAKELGYE